MSSEDYSRADSSLDNTADLSPFEVISPDGSMGGGTDEDVEAQIALQNLEKRRADKKRSRRLKIIGIGVVAGGLLAFFLGRGLLGGGTTPEEGEMVPETAVVERRDFESSVSASGALKAGTTVVVNSEVDGIIESMQVTQGDQVQKGDVLFTLKNEALDKEIHAAQQEVNAAQRSLSTAQTDLSLAIDARDKAWADYYEAWDEADAAHREWQYLDQNYEGLHAQWEADRKAAAKKWGVTVKPTAPEPVTTDNEELQKQYDEKYAQYLIDKDNYDGYVRELEDIGDEPQPAGEEPVYPEDPDDASLQSAINGAQESVTSANQTLTKAQESYDEAVKEGEKRTVKAPSAGNVVAVGAKVGDAVGGVMSENTGATTVEGPIVQISDIRSMAVDVEVNEIDILAIRKGQKAEVTFSAVSDVTCEATVTEVATVATGSGSGDEVDTGGGGIVTFHVGLVIPQPDAKLRPGMTASVRILTEDVPDALIVPTAAISEGGTSASVEVVDNEETMDTHTVAVKVGARSSSEAVIEEGLKEGDIVLLSDGSDELEEF